MVGNIEARVPRNFGMGEEGEVEASAGETGG